MCQSAWDKVGAQCILVSHLPFFIYKMRNFKIPFGLIELWALRIRNFERHLVWPLASPVGGHAVLVCTSLMTRSSFPRKAGHSIFRQLCLKKSPLLWRLPRASITGPAFASCGQSYCPTWHSQCPAPGSKTKFHHHPSCDLISSLFTILVTLLWAGFPLSKDLLRWGIRTG